MIRLRLSTRDLGRIRLIPTLGPFAETLSAARMISTPLPSLHFRAWRRGLASRLQPELRPLISVCGGAGPVLDLTTIVGRVETIDEGIDALLATPRDRLKAEINWARARRSGPGWPWRNLDEDHALRRQLGEAITGFHDVAVAPCWGRALKYLQLEWARQAQVLAGAGIDAFLAGLCPPMIEWQPPVLVLRTAAPTTLSCDLGGTGLTIVPSVFRGSYPSFSVNLADPGGPPRLMYPVVRDAASAQLLWPPTNGTGALAALLGRTRSAALEAIGGGCGTVELAVRLRISPAAASQHATVLRHAGLITTQRDGRAVVHALTELGSALLSGTAGAHARHDVTDLAGPVSRPPLPRLPEAAGAGAPAAWPLISATFRV